MEKHENENASGRPPVPPGRIPAVATPDQTRHDGLRPELAKTLEHAETSGIVELRKRKGNLEGM